MIFAWKKIVTPKTKHRVGLLFFKPLVLIYCMIGVFLSSGIAQRDDTCWKDRGDRWEGQPCPITQTEDIFSVKNVAYLWESSLPLLSRPDRSDTVVVHFDPILKNIPAKLFVYEPVTEYKMQTKEGICAIDDSAYSWPAAVVNALNIKISDLAGYLRLNEFISRTQYDLAPIWMPVASAKTKPVGFEVTFSKTQRMYIAWKLGLNPKYETDNMDTNIVPLVEQASRIYHETEREIKIRYRPDNASVIPKGIYYLKLERTKVNIDTGLQTKLPPWLVKIAVLY